MAEQLNLDGGWDAPEGSPFRSLTAEEVADARRDAERMGAPRFDGHRDAADPRRHLDPDADAPWGMLHPVMRDHWRTLGMAPADKE